MFRSHTGHQALYRFFPLVEDGKDPELPNAEIVFFQLQSPSPEVSEHLELEAEDNVIKLTRKKNTRRSCMSVRGYLSARKILSRIRSGRRASPHPLSLLSNELQSDSA